MKHYVSSSEATHNAKIMMLKTNLQLLTTSVAACEFSVETLIIKASHQMAIETHV